MFEKSETPSFRPQTVIFCVKKLTILGQKSVIPSIFKQALIFGQGIDKYMDDQRLL